MRPAAHAAYERVSVDMTVPLKRSLLDIITITKDDPEGLALTLQSTSHLRTGYKVRQIIIDGGNAEDQGKLMDELQKEPAVVYRKYEPTGIAAAFNDGIRESSASWIWFLNGGDRVHPHLKVENFLPLLEASSADAVIFDVELTSGERLSHPPLWAVWPPVNAWIPHPGVLMRRSLFDRFGLFSEHCAIAMDYEFWFRSFSKDVKVDLVSLPIAVFDTAGASYRNHAATAREGFQIAMRYLPGMLKIWLQSAIRIISSLWHFGLLAGRK